MSLMIDCAQTASSADSDACQMSAKFIHAATAFAAARLAVGPLFYYSTRN